MNEDGAQMEKQPGTDGDQETGEVRRRWMLGLLLATIILIVLAASAYFLFGRELFQRPLLIVAVVISWLGALVGIGRQRSRLKDTIAQPDGTAS